MSFGGTGIKLNTVAVNNEPIMLVLSLGLSASSSAAALKGAATPHNGGSDADRRSRIRR
jgi:hypothetical protein